MRGSKLLRPMAPMSKKYLLLASFVRAILFNIVYHQNKCLQIMDFWINWGRILYIISLCSLIVNNPKQHIMLLSYYSILRVLYIFECLYQINKSIIIFYIFNHSKRHKQSFYFHTEKVFFYLYHLPV